MNWTEFFAMDGRGFYVWGSFGAFLICIVIEIIMVRWRIVGMQREVRDAVAAGALGRR